MPRLGKFIDKKCRKEDIRAGWRRGEWGANGYGVSRWGDENVELHSCNGYTTLFIY